MEDDLHKYEDHSNLKYERQYLIYISFYYKVN